MRAHRRMMSLLGLGALLVLAAPVTGRAVTVNFTAPCSTVDWPVPAGVTSITVDAWGAQGGQGGTAAATGGLGGHATATIAVTPGETLHVNVGGQGSFGTGPASAGCNGGTAGGGEGGEGVNTFAAGGGGSSDVRQGGTALANRIVVAGGGGGGGFNNAGGAGGGTAGGPGASAQGGTGGTQAGPGTGGGAGGEKGGDGALGQGGAGGSNASTAGGGGGGGGGLNGGGGGGGGDLGGGGGGGSGFVPAGGTLVEGQQAANGLVTFTYSAPTPVTFRSLEAVRSARSVVVRWRTASEVGTLGFHVYRVVAGKRVRLDSALIPAHGAGSYSFRDRCAPSGSLVTYWLQTVNFDGSRRWYGPARASPR